LLLNPRCAQIYFVCLFANGKVRGALSADYRTDFSILKERYAARQLSISPQQIFFFFLVGRNSASFASARPRKSFAARRFVSRGEAKLPEFRLGGVTNFVSGGRNSSWSAISFPPDVADVQNSPHILLDI